MSCVSKAEFARQHGVSKPAVLKWERRGFLILDAGKIDVEASDARLREAKLGRFASGRQLVNSAVEEAPAATVNPGSPDFAEDASEFLSRLLAGQIATEAEADRVKANALAGLRALELRQKAGLFVEIETAQSVLFEQARAIRDAWTAWPARIAPLLAADLGVPADRIAEVLTQHVHQHLAELAGPSADFGPGSR